MGRYDSFTKEFILQRMISSVDSDIDTRQGSVVYDMLSKSAIEFGLTYPELDNVLTFGFLSEDTPSEYIDKRVGELGLIRKASVKSIGQLTFKGPIGTSVSIGTRVSIDDVTPIYFLTTQSGTIANGTLTLNAEAEVGGSNGNVLSNQITLVSGELSGVLSVTNESPFTGGTDVESDESLIGRYYEKVQKPATSGNIYHYEQWAKSVAGVGDAKVYPLWNGNGTVKIVLIDENKRTPSTTVINDTASYINSERPIGATVTVEGAIETAIDITATLTLVPGATLPAVIETFTSGLTDYLKTLAFVDPIVRYSKIAALLLDTPEVLDYANLKLNGGTANLNITDGSVAVTGSVTMS